MSKLVPTLAVLACLLFVFSCDDIQNPEFKRMKNVKFKSVSIEDGLNVKLSGDLLFFNPNDVGVEVSEMNFDVYANGKKVSTITQDLSATMPASNDFVLPLNSSIPLSSVFKDLKKGFFKDLLKKKKVDIRLDGTLKVGKAGLGMTVPFEYEETHELGL